jgi:hypothetical protein
MPADLTFSRYVSRPKTRKLVNAYGVEQFAFPPGARGPVLPPDLEARHRFGKGRNAGLRSVPVTATRPRRAGLHPPNAHVSKAVSGGGPDDARMSAAKRQGETRPPPGILEPI